jgi:PKD repeat protein
VHGDKQTGRVGDPLADSLVVQVTDSRGEPVGGATVAFDFSSAGSGAAVVPQQKVTNADGQADARLVLGTTVGTQTGMARVVSPAGSQPVEAPFSAIALSENANSMVAAGGENQTGHVLQPLDDRLVVEVTDAFGNPVAGVPITWTAEGGGSVSETVAATGEDGRSRVERILGPTVGQQTTVASSLGLAGSPVVFIHTAVAGDASRLTIVSGDGQTGAVGSLLPAELVVRLIDSEGNGVPNTAVTWVPAIGGGAPNPENTTTDADGRTSAQWTLGPALGGQRMDAVVSGVGVVSFTATATAGAPASLFIRTQPSSTARNGIPFDRQPVIQLRDPQGNDVAAAGVEVTVSLNGGGELEGTTRVTTDASGQATFTDLAISGAPGPRSLVFQAVGYAPVTSAEIVVAAIGTTTTITGDLPDPSQVGTPFTVGFRVASDGPAPTGNVTVSDGVQSCTGALSDGAGSCQLSLSTVGQRTLTATYAGTPGLSGSSDTESHTVTAAPPPPPAGTTTIITSDSPDPSVSGSDVTVTVRVTSSAGTPTGSVIITVSGGVGTCTATLSGGEGSCQVRLDNVGERTFTATYQGGPGFSGSSDTEGHTVTAQPPPPPPTNNAPDADYNWTCNGLTCQFTDASRDSDGNVVGWRWDFGDGGTSGEQNPSHTFPAAGTYTVTLTATDEDGATDASTADVRVEAPPPDNQPPTAAFTADCDELECDFDNDSDDPDGRIATFAWDFGDGATSDLRNPDHEYAAGGTYTVRLTVTDNDGATAFVEHAVTVDAPPPPPASTTTTITSDTPDPSDPDQPITVSFTVSASGGGTPTGTVTVTDDNGGGCTGTAPSGSCSYTPSGTGSRTIRATYEGDASFTGSSDTEEHTVTTPPPPNQAPDADYNWTCTDLTCQFTDGSRDNDGTVTGWVWDFGHDGATSGERNPPHTFPSAGTYSVTLTATDDDGATDASTANVTVEAPPPPNLQPAAAFEFDCDELECDFQSRSTDNDGRIVNYSWTFGDGETSAGDDDDQPEHLYGAPGTYQVMLTVTDEDGATGSITQPVEVTQAVNQSPVASIGSITCQGMNCSFTDDSTDPDGADTIASYRWVFGDDASSTEQNPSHAYTAPGDYPASLTVIDDGGLSSTDEDTVHVVLADGQG